LKVPRLFEKFQKLLKIAQDQEIKNNYLLEKEKKQTELNDSIES